MLRRRPLHPGRVRAVDGRCRFPPLDGDGDSWSSTALGSCGRDCNDADARARPDQTAYFATPHAPPGAGPSFDYDCDGRQTPRWTDVGGARCVLAGSGCGGSGWVAPASVPACGATATWRTCVRTTRSDCVPREGLRTQECR